MDSTPSTPWWERVLQWMRLKPKPPAPEPGIVYPAPRRVLLINFDPPIPSAGNRLLSQLAKGHEIAPLIDGYISDLSNLSGGYARFEVTEKITVDDIPLKQDGFSYTADDLADVILNRAPAHNPDSASYEPLIERFRLNQRVQRGEFDEVWWFGFPYAGFYESRMVGPKAFWCNAPPLQMADQPDRRYVIMAFNYLRGVGEMLESMGHRAESMMTYAYRKTKGEQNLWERFKRYDLVNPQNAEVGTVHFAPNSLKDYDWGNSRPVLSRCDNWLNFPDLSAPPRTVTCADWGNGEIRQHHRWWFERIPKVAGGANGVEWNWWKYIVDPNTL